MIKHLLAILLLFLIYTQTAFSNTEVRYFPEFEEAVYEIPDEGTEEDVSESSEAAYVDDVVNTVISEGKSISLLSVDALYNLPVGLYDNAEDPNYVIAIDSANIYSDHATFDAFLQVKLPIDDKILRFKSSDTRFTFENGIEGDFTLALMDTDSITISKGVKLIIEEGTSATWDCAGFKEINLIGYLKFSGDTFTRVDSKGVETGTEMTSTINVVIASFNDFFFEFSLPTFKVNGLDEVFFEFDQVCLDLSDTSNPEAITFPSEYPAVYSDDTEDLWQGLYIKQASIAFTKLERKDAAPIIISANDLLWDDYGLTCVVSGEDIMTLEEGSLASWSFSLKKFEIEIVAGQFIMAAFNGEILPDGFNDNSPMDYAAYFDVDGNYSFGISAGENLNFDLLMAEVNLESNSSITVIYQDDSFNAIALLYGDISLSCSESSDDTETLLSTPALDFEGLRIASESPNFDIESIALSGTGDNEVASFPVTFDDFGIETKDGDAYISFSIIVNLKASADEGFGGSTNISIVADTENNWEFKRVEINAIHIEIEKPKAYSIEGDIYFIRGDEVYGDGFGGSIIASFSSFGTISASALFGKVSGFRYFYVDALYVSETGLSTGTPITLYGFGGGLSYRVAQAEPDSSTPAFAESISGLSYTPDIDTGTNIRACVQMGVIDKELIQGEVTMSISFNTSGGLNNIEFTGNATVLSVSFAISEEIMVQMTENMSVGAELSYSYMGSPITIEMYMLLDFENNVFHAENEVFVDAAGVITGVGTDNRAGWMTMHIEDDEWYLHIGTPTDPVGLNFAGLAETNSYFMVGYDIPDDTPMHPKVLEYLNMSETDFESNRDDSQIISGNGVAFGSSFDFSTGDLNFLLFYANFELGFGFDIMLLRYDDMYYCEGEPQPMGIDHWYAKGQAYVYFSGEIGIQVKLFLKTKKFTILKLQCAAAVKAEGPNPFWALGVVGGNYKILGGLVEGTCSFEVEIGEQCNLSVSQSVSEQLAELEIISDISPANDATEVSIFNLPQIAFNMPVGQEVKISEDENTTRYFKVSLNDCSITKIEEEIETAVSLTQDWNDDKSVLALSTNAIFSPSSTYKITAEVCFLEETDGVWEAFKDDDGNEFYETQEVTFTTGEKPDEIPDDLIEYSYPLGKMINFYKDEYAMGYIKFTRDVGGVYFDYSDDWTQKVRLTSFSNNVSEVSLTYSSTNNMVDFTLPTDLVSDNIYALELMDIPTTDNTSVDRNIESEESVSTNADGTTVTVTTQSIDGEIEETEENAFLEINFRTSKYNTFANKIGADSENIRFLFTVSTGIYLPGATLYRDEMFDKYEIYGDGDIESLITISADLENADWYQQNVYPILYEGYPFHSDATIDYRDIESIGVPPANDIRIWQTDFEKLLTDEEIESGTFIDPTEFSQFIYYIPYYWALDYQDIRNKLSNIYFGLTKPAKVDYILRRPNWPMPSVGNYPINIKYRLPGKNTVTTTKALNLDNQINVNQIDEVYDEDMF